MRIDCISNTKFTSNKITNFKNLWKLSQDRKFTDIKPIKTYAQYLKEYGLDLKTRK